MTSDIFLLYANCVMVTGYRRTAIYDLQRAQIHFIPNGLAALFEQGWWLPVQKIRPQLDKDSGEIVEEYLSFMQEEELGFFCNEQDISLFPPLDTQLRFPAHITNCILDAIDNLWYFNKHLLDDLQTLCCGFVQVRFFGKVPLTHLMEIAQEISGSCLKNVEVILPANPEQYTIEDLQAISSKCTAIQSWILYNDIFDEISFSRDLIRIIRTILLLNDETHCGQVAQAYFAVNKLHYFESLTSNTCINRKIAIDKTGNIKNCPSMAKSFGSISDTTLTAALSHPEFRKYWHIAKDQIAVCKDCEFRYVCTDCRAYLEDPEDKYSKPLKCGYNPYTCQWEDWSTHPLKQKGIAYYAMQTMGKTGP